MNVTITFKEVNSEYNQEFADAHHNGGESEDNIKYTWEDELKVTADVKDLKIKNRATYFLRGTIDDEGFEYEIPDMTICECLTSDGQMAEFAVSRKLIKETEKKVDKNGDVNFIFYLKDNIPSQNPLNGIYIIDKDFPGELL